MENKLQLFYHIVTLWILLLMMCYTDFVPSAQTRYNLGYVQIGLLVLQLLPGVVIMIYNAIKAFILVLRRFKARGCRCFGQRAKQQLGTRPAAQPTRTIVEENKLEVVDEVSIDSM